MNTMRRLGVVRPALAPAFNQLSEAHGYGVPLDIPLRVAGDETNTVVAYWCSWAMDEGTEVFIRDLLLAAGLTEAEVTPIPAGATIPLPWRFLIFDGDEETGWTPDQVLNALDLDRLNIAMGP